MENIGKTARAKNQSKIGGVKMNYLDTINKEIKEYFKILSP